MNMLMFYNALSLMMFHILYILLFLKMYAKHNSYMSTLTQLICTIIGTQHRYDQLIN